MEAYEETRAHQLKLKLSTPAVLAAILALTVFLRMKFWGQPLQMDEGVYGYIGWSMLDGLVPYKDVFDHKPPGIYLLYSLVFLLSEPSALNIKVFASIYTMGTAVAVFLLARRLGGTRAGCWAALLFALFSCGPMIEGGGANTEIFMILPYTLAVHTLLKAVETGGQKNYLLFGLWTGLACLIKQVAVVNFLLVGVYFIMRMRRRKTWMPVAGLAADAAAVLVGVIIPLLPILVYFYVHGALTSFFYSQVSYNFEYVSSGYRDLPNLTLFFIQMVPVLSENGILWLLSLIGLRFLHRHLSEPLPNSIVSTLQEPERRIVFHLMVFWPVLSFLGVALGGRYFGHYFIQMIPCLAVLGGIGLTGLIQEFQTRGRDLIRQPGKVTLLGITVLSFLLFVRTDAPFYSRYDAAQVSFHVHGTPLFSVTRVIGNYLKERTQPEDLVYVWASDPEINFYALRKTPSPLLIQKNLKESALARVVGCLRHTPPRYIVAMEEMSSFTALEKYIGQNYSPETDSGLERLKRIYYFELYRRKEG